MHLFSSTSKEPLQTYDGEEMVQNKEFVSIYKRVPRQNSPIPKQVLAAAIHLGPGQSMKLVLEPHSMLMETKWPRSQNDAEPFFAMGRNDGADYTGQHEDTGSGV